MYLNVIHSVQMAFLFPDSNEEQVIDTTHYNLTLKSETQVEIEGGRSGRVKSKNEVTVTPLGSPAATRRGKTVRNIAQEELDSGSCDDDGDSSGNYYLLFELITEWDEWQSRGGG